MSARLVPTCTHWGNYLIEREAGRIVAVHPYAIDKDPTPIGQSLLNALDPDCRIPQPMVRKGYLKNRDQSDTSGRGGEPFVAIGWDQALDLAADALDRVRQTHGNESIYGGSYGWASAGRFHHAQSQVHRFLNTVGGYTSSRDTYSSAAAEIIVPHVLGMSFFELMFQTATVADIIKHTRLVVCFGGIAMKNTQITSNGLGAHTAKSQLAELKQAGIEFVNISPVRDDMSDLLEADWWAARPNSDVALMLGLSHTLVSEKRHDEDFLEQYCVGFERFLPYLLGEQDGQPKDADWAAKLSDIPAENIRELARRMAAQPTLLGISWSLQRSEHGEQTYWMATQLGALLGTHGLTGRGVAYGYGSVHNIGFAGRKLPPFQIGSLPRGQNPVSAFIPVARIADMLLDPGGQLE